MGNKTILARRIANRGSVIHPVRINLKNLVHDRMIVGSW